MVQLILIVIHEQGVGSKEHHVDKFHEIIDQQLEKIYHNISSSEALKTRFLEDTRDELGPQDRPVSEFLESLQSFQTYMRSAKSSAEAPLPKLDTGFPLSNYFVSTSHNTYLTGNQLYSEAAASAYTSVLLRGCRSVEVDVWDGEAEGSDSSDSDLEDNRSTHVSKRNKDDRKKSHSALRNFSSKLGNAFGHKSAKNSESSAEQGIVTDEKTEQSSCRGEPQVLHGHTLTKATSFRSVCHAIRDCAFITSDLPVIVSLEVHCSLDQQQMMVDIMQEAWKGLLVEDLGSPPRNVPRLEDLKKKILVKTKSAPLSDETAVSTDLNQVVVTKDGSCAPNDVAPKSAKPSNVLDSLAKMAIYTKAFSFKHFDQPEAKLPGHIFSLSEKTCWDEHVNQRESLFEHNRFSLMRIYPYAFRVNSSNLDPSFCWRRGAQLVALNWQNMDKGMMLNHGMFHTSPGWVLKPKGYRSGESDIAVASRPTLDLVVEVFGAQDLPLPPGDHNAKGFRPYVNCQLHVEEPHSPVAVGLDDASSGSEKSSLRRCTKSASGVNPDFKGQMLIFPTVEGIVEELSFIRFKIKDDEIGYDSLAAWACIRLDRLREGYRFVQLYDCNGEQSGGLLLIRVQKQSSQPAT
ncbi:hypothetical protein N7539_009201 [Penicillium diatomitis]|uniref:Phosphoinositide phospholipase C n=1 Tax=Penicillium diatomitis TaxID=2819901 RepID=A0A9X0BJQ7_9EURO|nr:uncharacterized protein N7539_009201 [Penicillium diatomitis]KAJ5469583.1 hypothetical protein N7539_009201 [Penicillium diatomitis]